jgi:hypothetical protein
VDITVKFLDRRLTVDEADRVYALLNLHAVHIPRDTCGKLTLREILCQYGSRNEGARRLRIRQLLEEALRETEA